MAKRILLVDDSAASRMKSRALLTNHKGYELVSACDGKEGVEKAIACKPDLILMDVEMPRMTGVEACADARSESQQFLMWEGMRLEAHPNFHCFPPV